jgi:hypothetical protein
MRRLARYLLARQFRPAAPPPGGGSCSSIYSAALRWGLPLQYSITSSAPSIILDMDFSRSGKISTSSMGKLSTMRARSSSDSVSSFSFSAFTPSMIDFAGATRLGRHDDRPQDGGRRLGALALPFFRSLLFHLGPNGLGFLVGELAQQARRYRRF